jgi:hypothetical protein
MNNNNKTLFNKMAIGVKKSAYFPCSQVSFDFCLGDLVKSSLNAENRYDDICVIQGIRFDRDSGEWIYGLRMIMSLSYWYEINRLTFKPNDEVEVSESFILPLEKQDEQKLAIAQNNYQVLRDMETDLKLLS